MRLSLKRVPINRTPEGVTVPIFNSATKIEDIDVVYSYLTTIGPGMSKGPIVHKARTSLIMTLDHDVTLEFIEPGDPRIQTRRMVNDLDVVDVITIPPGVAVKYRNDSDKSITLHVLADYGWKPNDTESVKYNGWDEFHAAQANT